MRFVARVAAVVVLCILSYLCLTQINEGGNHDVRPRGRSADDDGKGGMFERTKYNVDLLPADRSDVVDVMVCSDEKTIGGMVTVVNSVLANTQAPVYFHLLTVPGQISHVSEWLLKYHPNIVMEIIAFKDDLSQRLKIRGNTRKELASPLNFARYWIPELVPDINGRLVYLDDDVLVLGDIKDMRDQPISLGHVLTASADTKNTMQNFFNYKNPTVQSLGIGPDEQAFNAGVFVCDVDQWKKNNVTDKLVYWMERNTQEPIYGDGIAGGASQPPMLIALHGKVTPLNPSWHVRHFGWWMGNNYPNDLLQMGKVKLMHWNGRWKPWKSGKASKFASVWHQYYLPDPRGEFVVRPPDSPPMVS